MAATTAPVAKARILTALAARGALANVTRSWGGPTESEDLKAEMIHLGKTVGAGEWRTLGAGTRHESYTVALHVVVLQWGDDEQATETRAFALLDEVSAALTADKFLAAGGTQLLYTPAAIESWEHTNVPMPKQWGAQIVAQIRCQAMFTP
jgi:hypothetical protein